jgi:site-specific recombinase XerD
MNLDARLRKLEGKHKKVLRCPWCRYSLQEIPPAKQKHYQAVPEDHLIVKCWSCGTKYGISLKGRTSRQREVLKLIYTSHPTKRFSDERVHMASLWLRMSSSQVKSYRARRKREREDRECRASGISPAQRDYRNPRDMTVQMRGVKYYRQVPEAQNEIDAKVAEATLIREIYEGRYGKEGKEIGATDFVKYCKEVYKPTVQTYLKNWKHECYNVDTLCRYFRGERLKDITRMEVEKYRKRRLAGDSKRGRPRKPITVKGEIATLSHIFNLAIEDELIGLNPCRKIKWKKEDIESHRERTLSYEEEARLMQHLSGETRAAVIIALNTGLRRMGILRRKVEDVDLNQRIMRYIAKDGKKRIVPLNAKALEVIKELIQNATPEGHLFHNRKGYSRVVLSAGQSSRPGLMISPFTTCGTHLPRGSRSSQTLTPCAI